MWRKCWQGSPKGIERCWCCGNWKAWLRRDRRGTGDSARNCRIAAVSGSTGTQGKDAGIRVRVTIMNQCEFRERLSAYLDGELSGEQRAAFEQHLAVCGQCAAELESLRRMSGALKVADGPRLSPIAMYRLHQAIDRESFGRLAGLRSRSQVWRRRWRWQRCFGRATGRVLLLRMHGADCDRTGRTAA